MRSGQIEGDLAFTGRRTHFSRKELHAHFLSLAPTFDEVQVEVSFLPFWPLVETSVGFPKDEDSSSVRGVPGFQCPREQKSSENLGHQ